MKPTTAKRPGSGLEQLRQVALPGLAALASLVTLFASPAASGQASPPASPAAPVDSARPQGSVAAPAPPTSPPATATSTSSPAEPTPPITEAEHRPHRPWFGGFGYVFVGPYFGDLSSLDDALRAPTALGASYEVGRTALTLGVGGGAVLFSHLWLGIKGFGLATGQFENLRGNALLTGGGGSFELGYVLATRPRMLFIPYLGLGGFAYNLEVTNKTSGPMPIQQLLVIPSGESRTFMAAVATLDVGIRVERLLFYRRAGGFTAGFELGLLRSLSTRPWQSESVEFTDHPGAAIDGAYVRVNFGGGGFAFR